MTATVGTHGSVEAELSQRARSSGLLFAVLALLLVPAWGGFDLLLEPGHARSFIELRLACDLPIALCLWLLWSRPAGRRRPELLTLLILAVVQAEIAWMAVRAINAQDFYLLGFSLPLFASGCVMGGRSRWTAGVVAATWASFGAALLTAPAPLPYRDLTAAIFFVSTASIIGWIGHAQRYRLTVRELTGRAQLEIEQEHTRDLLARLERLSHEDSLTRLANRRRWDTDLETACARAQRDGSPLAVLLIDIDRFKEINDQYGHLNGDTALREVAALLVRRVRGGDLVARIGGDEYGVLLTGIDATSAAELAEQLRQEAVELRAAGRVTLSLSLGVAAASGREAVPRDLMARADEQLYRAKATRNAVGAAHLTLPLATAR